MRLSPRLRHVVMGGSCLLVAFVAACNLSDDDSFGFGFGGAGSSGVVPVPTQPPQQPSPCDYAGEGYACNYGGPTQCEVGSGGNAYCNDLLKCTGYDWELESVVKPTREAGACALLCPVDPEPGLACDTPGAKRQICEYQLKTCGCGRPRAKMPDAGKKDANAEGGADAEASDAGSGDGGDGGDYVWTCVDPGPGCPRVRPRIGSPCVRPITCDYGTCTFDDGVAIRCSGGYWLKESSFCRP